MNSVQVRFTEKLFYSAVCLSRKGKTESSENFTEAEKHLIFLVVWKKMKRRRIKSKLKYLPLSHFLSDAPFLRKSLFFISEHQQAVLSVWVGAEAHVIIVGGLGRGFGQSSANVSRPGPSFFIQRRYLFIFESVAIFSFISSSRSFL